MNHLISSVHYLIDRFHSLPLAVFTLLLFYTPLPASQNHSMTDFGQMPIEISKDGVPPRVLINTSNDHQLYFKAYNDYSDLDGDGLPETTYKHSIDYYGYFDSEKCYRYNTSAQLFTPDSVTNDKYCNAGSTTGQWSGNFLNWVSMSRIDAIRKILFGGHRRVDTATETVLERAYLPHDAHSWAKYYSKEDIPKLTPFTRSDYYCDEGNTDSCKDDGENIDWKKVGITLANTTDVKISNYHNNTYSEDYTDPPLIKVAKGNYTLWASNERWQCTWSEGSPIENHNASNENDPTKSGLHAYSSSPHWSKHLGEGNYIARVKVCIDGLIGKEKCKDYPGADLNSTADDVSKPIGLLQRYGDDDQMYFGMVAGSYMDHASGGVLIRNVSSLKDEVNVDTDGTFSKVSTNAGGIEENNPEGLINAWSLYRIIGYDGNVGDYDKGDSCPYSLSDFDVVTSSNRCRNWGNPFSEIYYQAVNYLAGAGIIGAYRSNSQVIIDGLPTPQRFQDPLDTDSYCADMFIINLNSSTVSYDYDELDGNSYGPDRIWDEAVLPGDKSSTAMTNAVGEYEGNIHGKSFYVGEIDLGSGNDDQLCTAKTITNLGETGGVCPEAPRLGGSYRIAGLSYYAHVEDIRPDQAPGQRGLEGPQTVDTFSVALAAGVPVIEVPDPTNLSDPPLVTILPACRNTSLSPKGNCALVDFKIVSQEVDSINKRATGSFYINWENSEQGGDFDQDMWGILDYSLDLNASTISITTEVFARSTGSSMGFGYVINGTNDDDGFHAHTGIHGFKHTEVNPVESGSPDCSDADGCNCRAESSHGGCNTSDSKPSTKKYTLGKSKAKLLKDPLWYAAKYGGFTDSNGNKKPDLQSEWDSKINSSGESGSDGIPDNYFFATNPRELEDSLTRVLDAILDRTSSGTAAAVVSNNVRGEGALYQAYYEPRRKDDTKEANWIGTLQALWLDSYGHTRQDCTPPVSNGIDNNGECEPPTTPCVPNGVLDNYCVDQVAETYFDEQEGRTRVLIYQSSSPDEFTALSMQGVVTSYSSGSVTMRPNSMEGNVSFSDGSLTLSPYTIKGKVTSYDSMSGAVEISVEENAWTGPADADSDVWNISTSSGPASGYSYDTLSLSAGIGANISFTVTSAGTWIAVGDTLTLTTKKVIGASGQTFNSWDIECIQGASANGTLSNVALQLNNSATVAMTISTANGDFSTCSRARLSTYNLKGTAGDKYSRWEVENLQTSLGRGTSTTEITLANSGEVSFTVNPIDDWLSEEDLVRISNYLITTTELDQIGSLWNAREQLYLPGVSDTLLASNRNYDTTAADGRFITTWIDVNSNNIIDTDEYRDFTALNILNAVGSDSISYTFFDVGDKAEAETLIDYIRGIETSGTRNRTIQYSTSDSTENVMRLGDIINSTPTAVGSPQEGFDLLYYDFSYQKFRIQYINRRNVIYVGGNDGLIHAFNGGFFTTVEIDGKTHIAYSTTGKKHDGSPATPHPLGSELWAYAPMNLLPHLQWLKDPNYVKTHVSFIDAKPRVFDAKIFNSSDADHPNGWGTVMVVGMNLGGGEMTLSVDHDNSSSTDDQVVKRRSAFVIFDITNPEKAPELLGEIQIPDKSFTTVYPAVVTFQDVGAQTRCNSSTACNSWYLMFGTGPNDLRTYESSQSTKVYLFDLKQLVGGSPYPPVNSTGYQDKCDVVAVTAKHNMLICDTEINNTFMGSPVVIDWDLDFLADNVYFGLVRESDSDSFASGDADSGRIMKMAFNDDADPTTWKAPFTFFNTDRAMSFFGRPSPSADNLGNHWLFFGSGRNFISADRLDTYTQSLFGVKDYEDSNKYPQSISHLLNVTEAEMYTDGALETDMTIGGNTLSTFDDIVDYIDNDSADGWYLELPPIVGTAGSVPSTRTTTNTALLGGVLFSSAFQPSENPCSGEGLSRFYALYYKTGTTFPKVPAILGSTIETVDGEVKYKANRYMDLGRGFATTPAIHSGSGSGDNSLRAVIQMSPGNVKQIDVKTANKIRYGRSSWIDQ